MAGALPAIFVTKTAPLPNLSVHPLILLCMPMLQWLFSFGYNFMLFSCFFSYEPLPAISVFAIKSYGTDYFSLFT